MIKKCLATVNRKTNKIQTACSQKEIEVSQQLQHFVILHIFDFGGFLFVLFVCCFLGFLPKTSPPPQTSS